MTGEDLEYKTGVLEQATFEHSPLGVALDKQVKPKTDKRNKVFNAKKQEKPCYIMNYITSSKKDMKKERIL